MRFDWGFNELSALFLVAGLNAILTKEQKTSEFRQMWIDALRNDLADFVGETEVFMAYAIYKKGRGESGTEFFDAHNEALRKAAAAYHRIRLRLNPEEHQQLLTLPCLSSFLAFASCCCCPVKTLYV